MRVVCFYSDLEPRAEKALKVQAPDAEFVDTSGDSEAYWRELNSRWDGSDDLMVVEHDNVLRGGEVESFASCDKPWCVYTYAYPGKPERFFALGCTKFSAAAMAKAGPLARRPWQFLDTSVSGALQAIGVVTPHIHGRIDHL